MNRALTLGGGDTGESLGQLRLENNSIYAGNITLAGDISGAGDGFFNGGFITGNIGESGGVRTLSKITSGTLTLSGANTYSGATSVLGGTLALTANLGNAGGASDVLGISSNAALTFCLPMVRL
ncbi:autotransporter-associated beta strand repeat-containing protein [Verrucomicrobium spinosum]|uniref:autotransporter-associated beta strand repeat-containing protein n=1 Tax=Verrucomicrobium spinosum TaxID=2736 RepID=UPI0009463183|nr:autotransporter-associated beta strand repeat-containing protein [Verrucomicrobium spinosum]